MKVSLTSALQDPDCLVRVAAALGIARLGDSTGADLLAAFAGGQDAYCAGPEGRKARVRAMTFLSYLGDPRCIPPALQWLCERPLGVSSTTETTAAIHALREVGALQEAQAVLVELLDDPAYFVGMEAAAALHEIGDSTGTEALIAFMTDPTNPNHRWQGITRAAELVDPVFQPVFESLTTHPDPLTAAKAVEALEKLQSAQGN